MVIGYSPVGLFISNDVTYLIEIKRSIMTLLEGNTYWLELIKGLKWITIKTI